MSVRHGKICTGSIANPAAVQHGRVDKLGSPTSNWKLDFQVYLNTTAETAPRLRSPTGRYFSGNSFCAFRFSIHVFLVCVFVEMLRYRCGRRTFRFSLLRYARDARWSYLLT